MSQSLRGAINVVGQLSSNVQTLHTHTHTHTQLHWHNDLSHLWSGRRLLLHANKQVRLLSHPRDRCRGRQIHDTSHPVRSRTHINRTASKTIFTTHHGALNAHHRNSRSCRRTQSSLRQNAGKSLICVRNETFPYPHPYPPQHCHHQHRKNRLWLHYMFVVILHAGHVGPIFVAVGSRRGQRIPAPGEPWVQSRHRFPRFGAQPRRNLQEQVSDRFWM